MRTVFWENNELKMIDQRILPARFEVVSYRAHKDVAFAITDMVVRGAPAIGAAAAGLTLDSVLPAGQAMKLKDTANLSTGGTSTDVTDIVHPYNVLMAERISKIVGLDICGIDLMTTDISVPTNETGGAVLEVNAAPGFRMHIAPSDGLARNVAANVIDMLFILWYTV